MNNYRFLSSIACLAGALTFIQPAAAEDDWSGIYLGAHLGHSWSSVDFNHNEFNAPGGILRSSERFSTDPSGMSGGVQFGVQKQFESILFGVEGAYTAMNLDDSARTNLNNFPRTREVEISDLYSVAARIGYAQENWLGYAKIGYANAELGFDNILDRTGASLADSDDRVDGLLLGLGVEYAFTENWSFGVDYSYVNFNAQDQIQVLKPGVFGAATNTRIDADLHTFSARLTYRFNMFN